jgi:hypothetical protein
MGEAEDRRALKLLAKRLEGMGVAIEVLPGGRCARGRMSLRRAPFSLLTGPETFEQLSFATVGITHIKCLEPAPLFQLPMIRMVASSSGSGSRPASSVAAAASPSRSGSKTARPPRAAWTRRVSRSRRAERSRACPSRARRTGSGPGRGATA